MCKGKTCSRECTYRWGHDGARRLERSRHICRAEDNQRKSMSIKKRRSEDEASEERQRHEATRGVIVGDGWW